MTNSRARKPTSSRPVKSATSTKAVTSTKATLDDAGKSTEPVSNKPPAKKATGAPAKPKGSSGGRRFGDGAAASGPGKGSPSPKSSGRGGRGRSGPPVKVAPPRPWGMIVAIVVVALFFFGVIGYAVVQANSNAVPDTFAGIKGISTAKYAAQDHVTEEQNYAETPPVGGLHDASWADCDGAIYDQQIRSENAVHSLEHGAVWLTYNPDDLSADEISVLTGYVENQAYILMSPFAGLSSPISLQSWNHQVFVDAVDDPRINEFIQVLRQNPEETPEDGASCSNPQFLSNPILEGETPPAPVPPAAAVPVPGAPPTT